MYRPVLRRLTVQREFTQMETRVLFMWSAQMMADQVCRPKGPCRREMVALGLSALSRPSSLEMVYGVCGRRRRKDSKHIGIILSYR
jgi:hypothetical protein